MSNVNAYKIVWRIQPTNPAIPLVENEVILFLIDSSLFTLPILILGGGLIYGFGEIFGPKLAFFEHKSSYKAQIKRD